MSEIVGIVLLLCSAVLGGLVGAQISRWRYLRLFVRLNAERDVRDQAVGADLIRQVDRMSRR